MRFEDGVGQERSVWIIHTDVRKAFQFVNQVVFGVVPNRQLKSISLELSGLDQQHVGAAWRFVPDRAKIGEAGGLQTIALQRFELGFKEKTPGGFEGGVVDGYDSC